jgi:hypothetical protein
VRAYGTAPRIRRSCKQEGGGGVSARGRCALATGLLCLSVVQIPMRQKKVQLQHAMHATGRPAVQVRIQERRNDPSPALHCTALQYSALPL